LQALDPGGIGHRSFELLQLGSDAFTSTADAKPTAIAVGVPMDRQASIGKGTIEGTPMAIPLGLGQGAVDIPQQRP